MSLRFVIGSEGSKKTEYLYRQMLGLCEADPECSVFYFVPDQATLTAQRELVKLHKNGCVMNIDILSLSRLKYRLSEELGDCFPEVLTDIGKGMLVKTVLLGSDGELTLYGNNHRKPGFVSEMKSMLSELMRYLVDADRLSELSEASEDPMLSHKLHDLSIILARFREALGDRYLTEEDIYTAMCGAVLKSKKLRGAKIFLNGFTGFTPSQFLLLRSLLSVCDEMTVALTMDAELYGKTIPGYSIFHMTAETIAKLGRIADEEQIEVLKPVLLSDDADATDLGFLKQNLFRRKGLRYSGDVKNVRIRSAKTAKEEVRSLVTDIERLVRLEGCRYREIGVILGDVETYAPLLSDAAKTAGIPCFVDYKTDVINNPLVDFIRTALVTVITDFRADKVSSYLKNPMSGYAFTDAALFENYLSAKGIRGYSAYQKPFTYRFRSVHGDCLTEINRIRESLVSDLGALRNAMKDAMDTSGLVRALYDFLLAHSCYEKTEELAERFAESEDARTLRKSAELRMIYGTVLNLLDDLNGLLGPVKLTPSEFTEVLDAGFHEIAIGLIPPEQDCITVGDIKRSRLEGIRHLFFIGVNDGSVPGPGHGSSILTEKEREDLAEKKLELSELPQDGISTEEFYIYLACAKPSDSLTLSYSLIGKGGKEIKPSFVIYRILNMFPNLKTEDEFDRMSVFDAVSADQGQRLFLSALRSEPLGYPFEKEVAEWFMSEEGLPYAPADRELLLKAAEGEPVPEQIPEEIARELYGQCLKGGVTMLEEYAKCAFITFLRRGLKLEEVPGYTPDQRDFGTIYHNALEQYSQRIREAGKTFRTLSEEESRAFMEDAVTSVMEKDSPDIFRVGERYSYVRYCLTRTLHHMTDIIRRQLGSGRFEPEYFEEKFRFTTEHMDVNGKIDRVDTYRDGKNYLKIIDYKSGSSEFDYRKIYDGRLLQLPVYMKAMTERDPENNVPAAMFYEKVGDPYVKAANADEAEKKRVEALCPSGLVLDREDIITGLDNRFLTADKLNSDLIPVRKNGGYVSGIATEDEMHELMDHAERKMAEAASEILAGNIVRNPVQSGQQTSCKYCAFAGLCKDFGEHQTEQMRKSEPMDKELFFAAIREEET